MGERFNAKVNDAMSGPPNFDKLWKLMAESESPTLEIKLYRKTGDKKPYRAIILVEGERDVEEVIALLDKRNPT